MDWLPMPQRDAPQLLRLLLEESCAAGNDLNGSPLVLHRTYLAWTTQAVRRLRPYLDADDLDRLVRTRDYWSLRSADPAQLGDQLAPLVLEERMRARDALADAEQALRGAVSSWQRAGQVVVPDTNVYLQHDKPVELLDWHALLDIRRDVDLLVAVPLLVIDELDRAKQTSNNKAQARHTLRRLGPLLERPYANLPEPTLHPEKCFGTNSGAVALRLYADHPTRARLARADDEIVAQSGFVGLLAQDDGPQPSRVTIVICDVGMVGRASLAGLRGHLLDRPDRAWDPRAHPWPPLSAHADP